ncbi:MAG: DUF4387 domain-containing protein [Alphaproteobacteria bacterium]|nr:DUF4387 domain-containing protein [Alphaproteobacteria bacterium]
MQPLSEVAEVIRSKNAGPFELTLDVIFKSHEVFESVRDAGLFTPLMIADLYGIPERDVLSVVHYEPARAIKATLRRKTPSGAIGDRDVYGAQQHAPLLSIPISLPKR